MSAVPLLQNENIVFILKDVSQWNVLPTIALVCLLLLAFETISHLTPYFLDTSTAERIPPGGAILHRRVWTDYAYLAFNKIISIVFVVHFVRFVSRYCLNGFTQMTLADVFLQIILPVPLTIAVYDFFYSPYHRFLHWPPIYPYIHKHHHRLVAPHRGYDDAINTHPFEYVTGMYLHLLAPYLVSLMMPVHSVSPFLFLFVGAVLNTINHTRFVFKIPFFYDSREHDTHHRLQKYNYASYFHGWDVLYGTYKSWTDPPVLKQRKGPAAPPLASLSEFKNDAPRRCVVTGGNGMVGSRLVSMLVERGAETVISVDLSEPHPDVRCTDARVKYVKADICDQTVMQKNIEGADAVFHVAALVGPYFSQDAYMRVNRYGTESVVNACLASTTVRALVVTSSPSTRLDGTDVQNLQEHELSLPKAGRYLQTYAESKAQGETFALAANGKMNAGGSAMYVCAIAPHQVYGKTDTLFLPSMLRAAASGQLSIFGAGDNLCSFTHVDNACHAHILAAKALAQGKYGGEFFIVTDGGARYLWDAINDAVLLCGLQSLHDKFHIEEFILYPVAYVCLFLNIFRRNPLRLNPFAVRMLTMNRHFSIEKITTQLGYAPIVSFETGWPEAVNAAKSRLEREGVFGGCDKNL